MFQKSTTMRYLALLSLAFTSFYAPAYDQKFNKQTAYSNLQSLGEKPIKVAPPLFKIEKVADIFRSLKDNVFFIPQLDLREKRELLFQILENNNNESNTISDAIRIKMELVYGLGSQPDKYCARYISSNADTENTLTSLIETESGHASLALTISQPHFDTDLITKRQKITAHFIDNPETTAQATKSLKSCAYGENGLLSYYTSDPFIDPKLLEILYWNLPGFKYLNNSSSTLQAGIVLNEFQSCLTLLSAAAMSYNGAYLLYEPTSQWAQLLRFFYGSSASKIVGSFAGIYGVVTGTAVLSFAQMQKNMVNLLQTQLIDVASYVNGAKEVYKIINEQPELAHNFSNLKALEALVIPSTEHSAEFNELIELLSTKTFKGKASFFSVKGRALRAHKLMCDESIRHEFADIIQAVGEMDVHVALAKQMSASAHKEARYSFVTFDATSTKPYIKATGIWNPFVPQDKAVTNDIDLGLTQPRNMVLSGPNTGGKSTFSKSVLLNAIMAQTFGIVAAKSMTMTPFANLDCYLNMTDDTASGISGLKAEILRARELLERIKTTIGFSLVLLDEIFIATSPDQAAKLALNFITEINTFKNALFIDAAHFEELIQFAENSPDCRNCHMGVTLDAKGTKVSRYTYKLAEGRSHVKNAAQVVEEAFSFKI